MRTSLLRALTILSLVWAPPVYAQTALSALGTATNTTPSDFVPLSQAPGVAGPACPVPGVECTRKAPLSVLFSAVPAGNGSATTPSLTFLNSNTTGFYMDPTTSGIGLSTGGSTLSVQSNRFVIPSSLGTWIGQTTFPVPQESNVTGHITLSGTTRGWGPSATIMQIFSGVNGLDCGGTMSCYINPHNRGYGGQDSDALNIFNYSRLPLVTNAAMASISPTSGAGTVTLANGTVVRQIHLTASIGATAIAAIVPLMRVEISDFANFQGSTYYYGYLIDNGLTDSSGNPIPPISADGTTLTVDGFTNTANADMPGGSATGSHVNIDGEHYKGAIYWGVTIKPQDTVGVLIGQEAVIDNENTSAPTYSSYDPNGDTPLINGIMLGMNEVNAGATGAGGSAFLASDGGNGGNVATWKRSFACRSRPSSSVPINYCVYNAFANVGFASLTPALSGGNYAFIITPVDMGGENTASLSQGGGLTVQQVTVVGSVNTGSITSYGAVAMMSGTAVTGGTTTDTLTVTSRAGTAASYACFTSSGQLVSSVSACP